MVVAEITHQTGAVGIVTVDMPTIQQDQRIDGTGGCSALAALIRQPPRLLLEGHSDIKPASPLVKKVTHIFFKTSRLTEQAGVLQRLTGLLGKSTMNQRRLLCR